MPFHLQSDSPKPDCLGSNDGLLLFASKFCPFCQRVELVLNFHDIPYIPIYINLHDKPDWYGEIYPDKKVPVLMMNGQRLVDSSMICNYLDEHPNVKSPLCANKDVEKAISDWFNSFFKQIHSLCTSSTVDSNDVNIVKEAFSGFKVLNALYPGPFLCGDQIGFADIMLYPFVNWGIALKEMIGIDLLDAAVMEWLTCVNSSSIFLKVGTQPICYEKFFQSIKAGKPDYSI